MSQPRENLRTINAEHARIMGECVAQSEANATQIAALTEQVSKLTDQIGILATSTQVIQANLTNLQSLLSSAVERVTTLERMDRNRLEKATDRGFDIGKEAIGWVVAAILALITLFSGHIILK